MCVVHLHQALKVLQPRRTSEQLNTALPITQEKVLWDLIVLPHYCYYPIARALFLRNPGSIYFPVVEIFHCPDKRFGSDLQDYTNNGVLSLVCMYLSLSYWKEENFVSGLKILTLYLCSSYLSKSDKVSVRLMVHLMSNS